MKELWIAEYPQGEILYVTPIYAESEEDARRQAIEWAISHDIPSTTPSTLRHYPNGFTFIFERIPGKLEEGS